MVKIPEEIKEKKEGKNIIEKASEVGQSVAGKVVDTVKNTANLMSPVKTRTQMRHKQLVKNSKWKHKKIIISGHSTWEDTHPKELIGEIVMRINGEIRFERYPHTNEPTTLPKPPNAMQYPPHLSPIRPNLSAMSILMNIKNIDGGIAMSVPRNNNHQKLIS